MAWTIRRPIRSKHLRAKYKDILAAYTNLLRAYQELYAKLHPDAGQLIHAPSMQEIAKVVTGHAIQRST